jgi:hypothetical protein
MATSDQVWFRHPENCWALGSESHAVRAGAGNAVAMRHGESTTSPPVPPPRHTSPLPPLLPSLTPHLPPPHSPRFPADIKQLRGKEVEVRDVEEGGGTFVVPVSDTHPCDPSHLVDNDDIAAMNNMHEGPLLALLKRRYFKDVIYTFTGDILISINPYKGIKGLYTIPDENFKDKSKPHVFAVAEVTYKMMLEETNPARKNQSMIVSGESGAGKTEACKHIMAFLATLSQRYVARNAGKATGAAAAGISTDEPGSPSPSLPAPAVPVAAAETVTIEKKVLDCNPFLEAFGNAKTVRNDNSSRFGKFLKIEYDGGRILGARIRHYLLEKARVVAPQAGERNYHIFYQLARGATPQERKDLRVGAVEEYAYLTSGGLEATFVQDVDDVAEFADVRTALTAVGMDAALQQDMWRIISGLMHLGNVRFTETAKEEAVLETPASAENAGALFGCGALPVKLVRRLMKVKGRKSAYEVTLNARQAAVARDSLAKATYERMFTWLIDRTNRILTTQRASSAFVGILDIFGFEIFVVNSFEQLCINYANEKLQNLFNHHIFVMEQEAYAAEGVDVTSIQFVNNQPCVDLIEKKPFGLLSLLDEICFLGRETTDAEYLDKIDKAHKGKHEYYGNPKKREKATFSVLHFAGEVGYNVTGFIEKNNDTLYTDLEELMAASDFSLIRDIFGDLGPGDDDAGAAAAAAAHGHVAAPAPTGGGPSDAGHLSPAVKAVKATAAKQKTQSVSTIASKFKTQLAALNDTLLATTPHYVRCVKPNKVKKPHTFDHPMVLAQLLYSGVLETVRIRRQGFPFRETFVEFWRRANRVGFTVLLNPGHQTRGIVRTHPPGSKAHRIHHPAPVHHELPRPPPPPVYVTGPDGKVADTSLSLHLVGESKAAVITICKVLLAPTEWTLGRNKVFMKDGALDSIIKRFRSYHTTRIQAWWRMVKVFRRFRRFRRSVNRVKKLWRSVLIRRRYAGLSRQITRLQAHVRRRTAQRRWRKIVKARANAGLIVLRALRANKDRRGFVRMREGFAKVASRYKARLAKKELVRRRAAGVTLRAFARMVVARRRFLRARYVKVHGCGLIQARWRGFRDRRAFRRARAAARVIQRVWRVVRAVRLRKVMFRVIIRVQAMVKRWKARTHFGRFRRLVRVVQAWWRMIRRRRAYAAARRAARVIDASYYRIVIRRALERWTQDLHAAASWGDAAEVEAVLLCKRPEHARVASAVPSVADRVRIRNRFDGLKTPLHTAAAGGGLEAVRVLVSRGAEPGALDSFGSTPVHKAAAVGDAALPVLRALLGLFTNPGAVANHPNAAGETALDAAVLAARNAPYGRRDHDQTIRFLLSLGCATGACGLTPAQAQLLADAPRPEEAAAAAAAMRERELMERRARERRDDPHYQLLFVGEAERRRREEAGVRRATATADAAGAATKNAAIQSLLESLGDPTGLGTLAGAGGAAQASFRVGSGGGGGVGGGAAAAYAAASSTAAGTPPKPRSLAEQYAEAEAAERLRRETAGVARLVAAAPSSSSSSSSAALQYAAASSSAPAAYAAPITSVYDLPAPAPSLNSGLRAQQSQPTLSLFAGSPPSTSPRAAGAASGPVAARRGALLSQPSFSSAAFGPGGAAASYRSGGGSSMPVPGPSSANGYAAPTVEAAAELIAASLTSLSASRAQGRRPGAADSAGSHVSGGFSPAASAYVLLSSASSPPAAAASSSSFLSSRENAAPPDAPSPVSPSQPPGPVRKSSRGNTVELPPAVAAASGAVGTKGGAPVGGGSVPRVTIPQQQRPAHGTTVLPVDASAPAGSTQHRSPSPRKGQAQPSSTSSHAGKTPHSQPAGSPGDSEYGSPVVVLSSGDDDDDGVPEIDDRGNFVAGSSPPAAATVAVAAYISPGTARPSTAPGFAPTGGSGGASGSRAKAAFDSAPSPAYAMPATHAGASARKDGAGFAVTSSSGGRAVSRGRMLGGASSSGGRAVSPARPQSLADLDRAAAAAAAAAGGASGGRADLSPLDMAPAPRSLRDHIVTPGADLRAGGGGGRGLFPASSPAPAPAPAPAPSPFSAAVPAARGELAPILPAPSATPTWTVHQSTSTGLLFFHNSRTGETQWTEPSGFDGTYSPQQLELLLAVQAGPGTRAAAASVSTGSASGKVQAALSSTSFSPPQGQQQMQRGGGAVAASAPAPAPVSASGASPAAAAYSAFLASGLTPAQGGGIASYVAPSLLPPVPATSVAAGAGGGSGSGSGNSFSNLLAVPSSRPAHPAPDTSSAPARQAAATGTSTLLRQAVPPLSIVGGGVAAGGGGGGLGAAFGAALASASSVTAVAGGAVTAPAPAPAPAAAAASSSSSSGGRRAVALGRGGWVEAVDGRGRTYFYSKTTGAVQWNKPADF